MARYLFNITKAWKKIFGKRDVPLYVQKAFKTAREYIEERNEHDKSYKGLLLLFDHQKHFDKILENRDLTDMPGRNMTKKKEMVKEFADNHGGRVLDSYTKEFFDLVGHGEESTGMEGAIAINFKGHYVDSGLYIEGVTTRGIQRVPDTGARHRAGAFASKNLVDYSVVVSQETGRITVFRDGWTYKGMNYKPKARKPKQAEEELYSEDLPKGE